MGVWEGKAAVPPWGWWLRVVDGAIESAAAGTGALGRLTRRTESGYVRSYAGYMLAGTVLVLIAVLAARF